VRYFSDAPAIRIGRRRLRRPRLMPLSELGTPRFQWFRVEPRPHHVATDPPNKGNPAYSNAVLFGPNHGRWIGYDRIEYDSKPVSGARESFLTVRRTRPSHPRVDVNGGLGTMRYKVRALIGSTVLVSTGEESVGRTGISPRVMRVTLRSDDTWVGHLRGYFNVPNVFGSGGYGARHQTALYQGADCADVIIGAAREAGARLKYTSVLGFKRYARPVTDKLLMTKTHILALDGPLKGRPVALRFGREVMPGDIMLIDYYGFNGSPRSWDHIAVIDRDRGVRGRLDPEDPVLHMGYLFGLTEEAAVNEAPAYIQILRFRPSIRRALRRHRRRPSRRGSS
jgi:hypothetical protein